MRTLFSSFASTLLFVLLFLAGWSFLPQQAQAQRVAVVNTEYILKQLPKYQAVTEEIKLLSEQWEKEYEKLRSEVEEMYKEYQAERVLLSNEQRIQREEKIEAKEREAAKYRSKRFGYQGDLFKLREEKMKPIRDEVFQAVEAVAKEKRADVIFDKAGSMVMLYTNPQFEYSDLVLIRMGVTPSKNNGRQNTGNSNFNRGGSSQQQQLPNNQPGQTSQEQTDPNNEEMLRNRGESQEIQAPAGFLPPTPNQNDQ